MPHHIRIIVLITKDLIDYKCHISSSVFLQFFQNTNQYGAQPMQTAVLSLAGNQERKKMTITNKWCTANKLCDFSSIGLIKVLSV